MLIFALAGAGFLATDCKKVQAAGETGVVTASLLNVRTGAGTDYQNVKTSAGTSVQLAAGTKVTILETLTAEKDGSSWYKVSFSFEGESLSGYASAQYIAIDTTAPSATPTTAPASTTPITTYRYETTYRKIKVAGRLSQKRAVYKKAGGRQLKVSKKAVILSKGKKVTITGEKLVKNKKWFKISFKYKKKTRTAYIRNIYVKMTLKTGACAVIANLKKAAKVHTKAGASAPYKKKGKTIIKIPKGATVKITKEKLPAGTKTKWYKLSFDYNGSQKTGWVSSKFVKLAKEKKVKKVAVTALTSAQFEKSMTEQGFPESYKQSLRILHQAYPLWQFQAYKTGVDWNTALTAECKLGLNLISNTKAEPWKSKEPGAYNSKTHTWKVFDGSNWVAASKEAIAYYMDPRNFLSENNVYQFELLEYQSQYQTKAGVDNILNNTPFYNKTFTYKDLNTGKSKSISYADAFVDAAKTSGVSPYHLASRARQEVVISATAVSGSVSGTNATYPGIYNFYNIGAVSSANPVLNGLKWASSGSTYLRPWTDRYRSIVGGGQYIGSSYIQKGQNTGYLQKFNMTSTNRFGHQYMTNVEAAYSEAIKTKKAYAGSIDKSPLVFSIPVYENMPASNCPIPH